MQYGTEFTRELTGLRRYARAISGNQELGDDLVVATLEAMMRMPAATSELSSRAAIFQLLSRLWNTPSWVARSNDAVNLATSTTDDADASAADSRLHRLSPLGRQAFLLVAMEEFSEAEGGAILDLAPDDFSRLLTSARREVAGQITSNILIIEDDLFISTELEEIVTQLGHRVVGVADRHADAVAMMQDLDAHLILADVQLADGSSGIDAVREILTTNSLPVVFVTAFPERLLTGSKSEPTYLVRKPFRVQEIRAAVSQALFFAGRSAGSDNVDDKVCSKVAV